MMKLPVATNRELWRGVAGLMGHHRWQLTLVVILQVAAASTTAALPWLTGDIIDRIQSGTQMRTVLWLIGVALVIVAFGAVLTFNAERRARVLGETVFAQLREELVETITHLPLSVVEEAGTGDLLGRSTHDIERIQFMVRQGISAIMAVVTTIVVTVVASVLTSPLLSLTLIIPIPLIYLTMRWYLPRTVPAYRASATAWANMSGVITESLDQAEIVDAARLRPLRDRRLDEAIRAVWRLERYTAWQRLVMWTGLVLAVFLPVGATIILGAYLYPVGLVTAGQITTVALYCYQVRGPVWEMTFWVDELQSAQAALGRIFGVQLVEPDRHPSGEVPETDKLDVDEVHYSYRSGSPVLHGVSLDLAPGEVLALVGPSGAGKSTLGRLVAGIHPPEAGSVRLGGVELVDLTEERLQREVAFVSQEHHVFGGTVADNLRLAKADASDEELKAALATVGASPWVEQLPDGLETKVGTGGKELSPGQSQQLALARIVLQDPTVLVLDEATSLMDPGAARTLERGLGQVMSGRTVIAVAHRLHTAHAADRVAVMVDGRLAELGTHDELVRLGGEYAKLWSSWQNE